MIRAICLSESGPPWRVRLESVAGDRLLDSQDFTHDEPEALPAGVAPTFRAGCAAALVSMANRRMFR